ncbi:MAG: amidohydrolase family protein, partial [[Eubacterium] sulci]|nr:amidohydrolase family protein [[Eubacterium] sulci]
MIVFKNIDILDENFQLKQNVSVRVEGNIIKEISSEPIEQKEADRVIDGKNRVLIPGFVNAHAHSPMSLMRGYGENMSLQDWLFKRIFPFEDKLNSDAVYYGTLLTMAESFKYGIVSTSDMYYFVDDMVRAALESGAKANISRSITNPAGAPFDSLASVKEAVEVASK